MIRGIDSRGHMADGSAARHSTQDLSRLVQVSLDEGSTNRVAWLSAAQDEDMRRSQRQRVLLSALVVDREFKSIFRCQVRNASDQGAGLRIPDSLLVPEGFWLVAISWGLAYEARLAWRRYPNAGVLLAEPIDLQTPIDQIGRQLRDIWRRVTA
jgi:hypothetical protein